eukprot:Pgem_evm1s7787
MSSGVQVNQECVTAFSDLKLGHKHRYFIMKINDSHTEVVVIKKAAPDATYDEFVAELKPGECCYAVYDLEFETDDGRKTNKICFVVWAPDDSKIKAKMITAASKEAVKRALTGISTEIQATSADEIEYDAVLERAKRN